MTSIDGNQASEDAVLLCGAGPLSADLAASSLARLRRVGLAGRDVAAVGRLVQDRARSRPDRVIAVDALADGGGRRAEELLISALEAEVELGSEAANLADDPVVAQIVAALGRIGSEPSLAALASIGQPVGERAREQWSFANELIRFRIGRAPDDRDRQDRRTAVTPDWDDVPFVAMARAEVADVTASLVGSTLGIATNPTDGLRFDCGSARHALLWHEQMVAGRYRQVLEARPMIAGLIVGREPQPAAAGRSVAWSTVRLVILTEPTDRGVAVTVHRTDGQVVASGLATERDGALVVRLRDDGRERAALSVDGTITDDSVELRAAVATRSRPKNPGRSMEQ